MIILRCIFPGCDRFYRRDEICPCGKDPCDTAEGGCYATGCPDHFPRPNADPEEGERGGIAAVAAAG